jgi:uncharacterized C2H2 Zn-finger protein
MCIKDDSKEIFEQLKSTVQEDQNFFYLPVPSFLRCGRCEKIFKDVKILMHIKEECRNIRNHTCVDFHMMYIITQAEVHKLNYSIFGKDDKNLSAKFFICSNCHGVFYYDNVNKENNNIARTKNIDAVNLTMQYKNSWFDCWFTCDEKKIGELSNLESFNLPFVSPTTSRKRNPIISENIITHSPLLSSSSSRSGNVSDRISENSIILPPKKKSNKLLSVTDVPASCSSSSNYFKPPSALELMAGLRPDSYEDIIFNMDYPPLPIVFPYADYYLTHLNFGVFKFDSFLKNKNSDMKKKYSMFEETIYQKILDGYNATENDNLNSNNNFHSINLIKDTNPNLNDFLNYFKIEKNLPDLKEEDMYPLENMLLSLMKSSEMEVISELNIGNSCPDAVLYNRTWYKKFVKENEEEEDITIEKPKEELKEIDKENTNLISSPERKKKHIKKKKEFQSRCFNRISRE